MRFHVIGMSYLPLRAEFNVCAYTQKTLRFLKMLMMYPENEVIFYGIQGSEAPCKMVNLLSNREWRKDFRYDWKTQPFVEHLPSESKFNQRGIEKLNKRLKAKDLVLCPIGCYSQPIIEGITRKDVLVIEPGIGYTGVFAPYKVFESYAWMHYVYGTMQNLHPSWADRVIPNTIDLDEFVYSDSKDEYFLFIGRGNWDKGLCIAADVAIVLDKRLVVAGQGLPQGLTEQQLKQIDFIGVIAGKEKAEILSKAKVLFAPSMYVEPFGNVTLEAMASGTPVLTSDWGGFSENVKHGLTGYRCRTLLEFVHYAGEIGKIDSKLCRAWAEHFTVENIAPMYQGYFEDISRDDYWGDMSSRQERKIVW